MILFIDGLAVYFIRTLKEHVLSTNIEDVMLEESYDFICEGRFTKLTDLQDLSIYSS